MINIAVIEDDSSQSYRYKQQLEINDDINVDEFNSVEKFIKTVEDVNKYNIIISDFNLGNKRMNGIEFFEKIKDNFEGKMILLTGEGGFNVRKKTWFKRIDYMEKSINIIEEIENKYLS